MEITPFPDAPNKVILVGNSTGQLFNFLKVPGRQFKEQRSTKEYRERRAKI